MFYPLPIGQVIARELDTDEKLSSTATMTVDIEDMNDNAPVFTQAQLTLDIPEDTAVNTPVATYIVSCPSLNTSPSQLLETTHTVAQGI